MFFVAQPADYINCRQWVNSTFASGVSQQRVKNQKGSETIEQEMNRGYIDYAFTVFRHLFIIFA